MKKLALGVALFAAGVTLGLVSWVVGYRGDSYRPKPESQPTLH